MSTTMNGPSADDDDKAASTTHTKNGSYVANRDNDNNNTRRRRTAMDASDDGDDDEVSPPRRRRVAAAGGDTVTRDDGTDTEKEDDSLATSRRRQPQQEEKSSSFREEVSPTPITASHERTTKSVTSRRRGPRHGSKRGVTTATTSTTPQPSPLTTGASSSSSPTTTVETRLVETALSDYRRRVRTPSSSSGTHVIPPTRAATRDDDDDDEKPAAAAVGTAKEKTDSSHRRRQIKEQQQKQKRSGPPSSGAEDDDDMVMSLATTNPLYGTTRYTVEMLVEDAFSSKEEDEEEGDLRFLAFLRNRLVVPSAAADDWRDVTERLGLVHQAQRVRFLLQALKHETIRGVPDNESHWRERMETFLRRRQEEEEAAPSPPADGKEAPPAMTVETTKTPVRTNDNADNSMKTSPPDQGFVNLPRGDVDSVIEDRFDGDYLRFLARLDDAMENQPNFSQTAFAKSCGSPTCKTVIGRIVSILRGKPVRDAPAKWKARVKEYLESSTRRSTGRSRDLHDTVPDKVTGDPDPPVPSPAVNGNEQDSHLQQKHDTEPSLSANDNHDDAADASRLPLSDEAVEARRDREQPTGAGDDGTRASGYDPTEEKTRDMVSPAVDEPFQTETTTTQDGAASAQVGQAGDDVSDIDGPVVRPEDRELVTDYLYFALEQSERCTASETERTVKGERLEIGLPGLACRHCQGNKRTGRYFPRTAVAFENNGRKVLKNLLNHLAKCDHCPSDIREKLVHLDIENNNKLFRDRGGKTFLLRLFRRIHSLPSTVTSVEVASGRSSSRGRSAKRKVASPNGERVAKKPRRQRRTTNDNSHGGQQSAESPATDQDHGNEIERTTRQPDGRTFQQASSPFVVPGDRELISECLYLTFQQMVPCRLGSSDFCRRGRRALGIGYPGIKCMHCCGQPTGRYFPSSETSTTSLIQSSAKKHLLKCEHCPGTIRSALKRLQDGTTAAGGKQFARLLWHRIQNAPSEESSPTAAQASGNSHPLPVADPDDKPHKTDQEDTRISDQDDTDPTPVVIPDDETLISSDRHYLALQQMHWCRFTEADFEQNARIELGAPGIACRHCSTFRYFYASKENFVKNGTAFPRILLRHLVSCDRCPRNVRERLGRNDEPDARRSIPATYLRRLWERLFLSAPDAIEPKAKPKPAKAMQRQPSNVKRAKSTKRNRSIAHGLEVDINDSRVTLQEGKSKRRKRLIPQKTPSPVRRSVNTTEAATHQERASTQRLQLAGFPIEKLREEAKAMRNSSPPDDSYVEEIGFLHHNPYVPLEDLAPLPCADYLPNIPENLSSWASWRDKQQRIFLADFTGMERIPDDGKEFLSWMMQRDDITVISQGIMHGFDQDLWSPDALEQACGDRWYHKFRHFRWVSGKETYVEQNGYLSMKVGDYCNYLAQRDVFLMKGEGNGISRQFHFVSGLAPTRESTLDLEDDVVYMLDFDMPKLLPQMHQDFVDNFKIREMLPGGEWCMMNKVPKSGRPFMGPNLYMTPGGSFTHFHQDGHGTVDSGHYNVTGYNEVIMLRRLPEVHKRNACQMVPGANAEYDALYGKPHDSGSGIVRPDWPTVETVEKWRKMNYCPSVFILEPGQHIHINKGRLHAFRKLETRVLPGTDCHAELRNHLVAENKLTASPLCVSVAFDWMFMGTTSDGINREVAACLECASLNRDKGVKCLAIPETAVLCQARTLRLPSRTSTEEAPFVDAERCSSRVKRHRPNPSDICRGILPSLRYVIGKSVDAVRDANCKQSSLKSRDFARCEKVTVAPRPDTYENPDEFTLDPDGSDYFCRLCHRELSNVYMHCEGCEELLQRDYNICVDCHAEQRYASFCQMNTKTNKRRSLLNHTGDMRYDRSSRCPCKNGPACQNCGYCVGCSCRCHTWFRVHNRFHEETELEALRARIEAAVDELSPIRYAKETELRLRLGGLAVDGTNTNSPKVAVGPIQDTSPTQLERATASLATSPSGDNKVNTASEATAPASTVDKKQSAVDDDHPAGSEEDALCCTERPDSDEQSHKSFTGAVYEGMSSAVEDGSTHPPQPPIDTGISDHGERQGNVRTNLDAFETGMGSHVCGVSDGTAVDDMDVDIQSKVDATSTPSSASAESDSNTPPVLVDVTKGRPTLTSEELFLGGSQMCPLDSV